MTLSDNVVVVTGAGGMGCAVARRIGLGAVIFLADFNQASLGAAAASLAETGYDVVSRVVDVSQRDAVQGLVAEAADRGSISAVVHTAGVSPVQATV